MWTRGDLSHTYGASVTGRQSLAALPKQLLARAGTPHLALPPPVVMHDPSDPKTWTTPVRWT